MSKVQWAFEYTGLKEKELEYWKTFAKTFKIILINMLGLNIFGKKDPKEEYDPEKYFPLSFYLNQGMNEELFKQFFDEMEVEKALEDEDYERKVSDPDAFLTELELIGDYTEAVVEEEANSFDFPEPKKPKVKIEEE